MSFSTLLKCCNPCGELRGEPRRTLGACHAGVEYPTGQAFKASLVEFRTDPVHYYQWGEQIGVVGGVLKYARLATPPLL